MVACGWEVLGCEECSAYATLSPELQAEAEAWAVERLWQWTNQRFGPCEYTLLSPDDGSCCCWLGHRIDLCGCKRSGLLLPGPIAEPLLIERDGVEVSLESVRVVDNNVLELLDGSRWTHDWEITYLLGEPVPPGGELVAGLLACEYAKSICGDDSCRLPRRVSSIQRQGVVIGILDNFTNLKEGFTGIFEIDDWIMAQIKPRRRAVISSPDVPVPRIVTWTYADS